MRTLLILRHGKAENGSNVDDRDRPLTQRGKEAARAVGLLLREDGLVPDRIISSSALRARDTARRVAAAAKLSSPLDELDDLYLAEPDGYVSAVKRLAADAERILLVGHNPGLEALATLLTGEPVSLATAALAVCELPITSFLDLSLDLRGKLLLQRRCPAED